MKSKVEGQNAKAVSGRWSAVGILSGGLLCLLLVLGSLIAVHAQTSSFTYQGKLADAGVAANGTYDITFKLYDTLANGTQVGNDIVRDDVVVTDGEFTVDLDFGVAAFASGASRFLQLEVRPGASSGPFTPLVPRQPLTSSPYAVKAANATTADSLTAACVLCVTDANIFSLDGSKVTGTISGGNLSANSITADKFAEAAVTEYAIRDGNVTTSKIADAAVTNGKLAAGSVDSPQLANNSVTTAQIANGAVKTEDLDDESVTGNKIKTGAAGTLKWFVESGDAELRANTGVVANSTSQIRLQLPDSPSPGDFFRVIGSDTGGFRITQNGTQSISVGNGSIPRIFWTPRDNARQWRAIASSADGSRLIAAVEKYSTGSPGFLYVSTDGGATWAPRESSRYWSSVASSADGMRLIASEGQTPSGSGGLLYISNDGGTSWAPRESPRRWNSVTSSADGVKLAAAVANGLIYTSADSGETWVPRSLGDAFSVASSADGATLIAAVARRVYKSTDSGESWTISLDLPSTSGLFVLSVAMSPDGTKLVAGGSGNVNGGPIYVSSDGGANWTPRAFNQSWVSVAISADGTRLAAVAGPSQIYTSNDGGLTWTPTETARDWRFIASSADGEKLFAVADGAPVMVRGRIKSTPGTNGGLIGASSDTVELIYVGAGKFLIIDLKGSVTLF